MPYMDVPMYLSTYSFLKWLLNLTEINPKVIETTIKLYKHL